MLELPYCLVIEATDEPDYFGFYSPDLEGFTGIGHSVEDCLYQAKWGMREFLQFLAERNIPIPPRSQEPTVTIMNMRRNEEAPSIEHKIRKHEKVQRLLRNKNRREAAEAAIAYFLYGVPSPVEAWKQSKTWKEIQSVIEQQHQPRATIP